MLLVVILGLAALAVSILIWGIGSGQSKTVGLWRPRYERALWLAENGRHAEAIPIFAAIADEAAGLGGAKARTMVANAKLQRANALQVIGRSAEAASLFAAIEKEYGRDVDSGPQLAVCRALVWRANLVRMEGMPGGADQTAQLLDALDDLVSRHGSSRDRLFRRVVAEARVMRAGLLGEGGQSDAGLALLDEVLSTASQTLGGEADRVAVSALAEKGSLLEARGDYEAALAAYRASRDRAARDASLKVLGQTGGLIHEARVLRALGRPEEALTAYEAILAFEVPKGREAHKYLIAAAKGRVNALWKLGRRDEALLANDQFIELARQWGDDEAAVEAEKTREQMARHLSRSVDEGTAGHGRKADEAGLDQ